MPVSRPLAVSVGLAAGLVAAVGFYTAAAGADAPQQVTAKPQPVPAVAVVTPAPVVSLAPCTKPAKLEHGACVTHKVVTKVVAAKAPAAVPARQAVRVAAPAPAVRHTVSTATHPAAVSATSHPAATPTNHEAADPQDPAEVKHEDVDHEDTGGTGASEPGDDHGDDHGGDDSGEPGDN